MALVTYLIGPCVGGASINVDFNSTSLPTVGGNYFLRFTGATTEGCCGLGWFQNHQENHQGVVGEGG